MAWYGHEFPDGEAAFACYLNAAGLPAAARFPGEPTDFDAAKLYADATAGNGRTIAEVAAAIRTDLVTVVQEAIEKAKFRATGPTPALVQLQAEAAVDAVIEFISKPREATDVR